VLRAGGEGGWLETVIEPVLAPVSSAVFLSLFRRATAGSGNTTRGDGAPGFGPPQLQRKIARTALSGAEEAAQDKPDQLVALY